MKITEISKIPARDYTGVDTLGDARVHYMNSTKFKKFSDSDFYYLDDDQLDDDHKILIAVPNTTKKPTPNGLIIVGVLNVYTVRIRIIYDMPVVEVGTIAVDKKYRGQGIAGKLYDVVLKSGRILFAGDTQTPGGRAMWSNLYRRPDVEVTGWVKFYVDNPSYSDYSDDEFIKFIEQQGGAYLGESTNNYYPGNEMYFEFAVEQLPTKAELATKGKKSPIKVYNTRGSDTGLMARYIG
jgi:GNAT superfamily N-acetyltransferase